MTLRRQLYISWSSIVCTAERTACSLFDAIYIVVRMHSAMLYAVVNESRSMDAKLNRGRTRREEKEKEMGKVRLLPTPGKWGYRITRQ